MPSYPQTGSNINDPKSGKNRTGTSLSTNIVIKVNGVAVGAIQSISISEDRSVKMINELGTDGSIDSAPSESTKFSGQCERIRFDRLRIAEAFGRGFVHAHSQRYPFDIEIYDTFKGDGENTLITTIKNVWITKIDVKYGAQDFIISESMSYVAEGISSYYASTHSNAATGGERGDLTFMSDPIERAADKGANGRRGSLDAPGLISAFDGSAF
jgi:hypothetical protein